MFRACGQVLKKSFTDNPVYRDLARRKVALLAAVLALVPRQAYDSSGIRIRKVRLKRKRLNPMKTTMLILISSFVAIGLPSSAQKTACTQQQAIRAEGEIDSLRDWDGMHKFYQDFSKCDDGGLAEGYSDAVGNLLAHNWEHFDRLASLANADKGFQRFVLKHIDDTLPADTLQQIANNARSHCPSRSTALCRLIEKAAAHR